MEELNFSTIDNQQNEKIKEFIKKFNNPEKFISKILNSLPYSFSIIDIKTNYSELTNNKNCLIKDRKFLIKDLEKTKAPIKKEKEYIDDKGNKKIIEIHAYPIFDTNGQIVKIIECCIDITDKKNTEKNLQDKLNKIEKEKEILEKKIYQTKIEKINFTPKEKIVLYGMSEFPSLRDEELAKELNIKRSTVTAIKNRLKNQKDFTTLYLPNFKKLKCSTISIINDKFNISIKERKTILKKIHETPEIIFNMESDKETFKIFTSEKYTELQKFQIDFANDNSKIMKKESKTLRFFYDLDKILLFNPSQLINIIFNLQFPQTQKNIFSKKTKTKPLNNNEKRILHHLIKFPEDTITESSKKIWISKPTISKIKKQLIEQEYIIPFIFPNLQKLNIKFLAIVSGDKNYKQPQEKIIAEIENNKKIIKILLFESQEEYENFIQETNYQTEIIFPIDLILSKKIDFHSLTEKLIFD